MELVVLDSGRFTVYMEIMQNPEKPGRLLFDLRFGPFSMQLVGV